MANTTPTSTAATPAAPAILRKPQRNPQLNKHGELIHLLSTEGLPKANLLQILDTAEQFLSRSEEHTSELQSH